MMVWALQYMGIRVTTPETTKMIPEVSTKWTFESLFSKQAVHLAPASPEASPKRSAKSIYEQRKRYSTEVMADVSQYPVNHLVTFCLGEEDGVHTVEDASRKLALMDSQGRVWAQDMLLRVSPKHVALLDPVSKEELESYPLSAIVRCDTVIPPGQSCSLLLLVCQEPERTQPDVHFFQGLRLEGNAKGAAVPPLSRRRDPAPAAPPDEGLLTLRAKPPSEAEFIDVLQKIKYAFSLLGRLRGNIANPSSPELLHFLFGPLQMIVDTSGGPQFASCVRRPHLTSEAVALLWDNVTQLENTLWTSLGDSWTRPGMELPSEEGPPYRPEFYSGWEPPATDPQGRAWEDPVEKQLQHERRRQQVRLRLKLPQVTQGGRDSEFWGAGLAPADLLLSSPAAKRSSGRCQWVSVSGHQDQEPEAEPQGLEPAGNRAAPGPRTPEPQLSPRSNASEVRAWLQGKGFSS
ncbi:hypothetical protein E2I00_009754, partial [Balaenoptera physalus]